MIAVINVPIKPDRKMHITLSVPFYIDILPDRQYYVCSHFTEVSTATESDVLSGHSKGVKTFHAGKV